MEKSSLSSELTNELLDAALQARKNAYAPYSNFSVGAAVLTADGQIFTGSNIENASYGATVCAERVAIFKAVSSGYDSIKAIAVIADHPEPVSPCGICRQVLGEFGPHTVVVMANTNGQTRTEGLNVLLPYAFEFPKSEIPK